NSATLSIILLTECLLTSILCFALILISPYHHRIRHQTEEPVSLFFLESLCFYIEASSTPPPLPPPPTTTTTTTTNYPQVLQGLQFQVLPARQQAFFLFILFVCILL